MAALSLVLAALSAVTIVVQAVALAHVVERSLLHHESLSGVAPALVLVGVAVLVRSGLQAAGELTAHGAAERVVTQLRGELLEHALTLGPAWLAGERPGELSVTATRGLRSLHTYYARYLPQAAAAALIPALLLIWVGSQNWLAFLVVIALVLAVPITMVFFGREAAKRSERQWRRLGSLAGRFLQLVEGLPTLRAFGRQEQGRREVEAATEGVRSATMRTLRSAFLSALSMDMLAGFGVGLVAMVLGLRLLWGELDLQTAMAVLLVAPEIFIPLRRAGAEFHASAEGQAAAARVLEVLATPLPGGGGEAPAPAPTRVGSSVPALCVEGLRVTYAHRDEPALDDVSLDLAPGTRVALTGGSGAGKSTVVAALLRLREPDGGSMRLDGVPSTGLSAAEWRACFSWLPQRPHLFTASLADNLRLGAPGVADEDLVRMLDAVGLSALMANLPQGLATQLGHDGLTLSAGERQRVALARALLRPAPIVLLDEPTSSLDPPTVARMAPALEPWLGQRTIVVAAHEPALLPSFDKVVALPAHAYGLVTS